MFRARLSRRIALWIFLNFLVVETVVLVPSVLRQADRLGAQLRAVTNGKVEWLLENEGMEDPGALLAAVRQLQGPAMVRAIQGAVLYDGRSGRRLGGFGTPPQLPAAEALGGGMEGRWFPLHRSYEAIWGPRQLPGELVLVVRHDATALHHGLRSYVLNIALIVLGIAAFLTLITMLVMHRLVIGRILRLRDRLQQVGEAFGRGEQPQPDRYRLPPGRADEVGEVEQAFNQSLQRTASELQRRLAAEKNAEAERDRAEDLLLNILPAPIATQMKAGGRTIAEAHPDVSVLFADIVGFTELSGRLSSRALVDLLNQVFSAFDQLCDQHGLEKIKTIGDSYMVVGGLPLPRSNPAEAIAAMALDMQQVIRGIPAARAQQLQLRVGIHAGPVVAGVIGRRKFSYDLWGDTVNIASRLEANSSPGRIHVSSVVAHQLMAGFVVLERGPMAMKGVEAMTTYWLEGRREAGAPERGILRP
jgi:class 3 adenylate cyclase